MTQGVVRRTWYPSIMIGVDIGDVVWEGGDCVASSWVIIEFVFRNGIRQRRVGGLGGLHVQITVVGIGLKISVSTFGKHCLEVCSLSAASYGCYVDNQ